MISTHTGRGVTVWEAQRATLLLTAFPSFHLLPTLSTKTVNEPWSSGALGRQVEQKVWNMNLSSNP